LAKKGLGNLRIRPVKGRKVIIFQHLTFFPKKEVFLPPKIRTKKKDYFQKKFPKKTRHQEGHHWKAILDQTNG